MQNVNAARHPHNSQIHHFNSFPSNYNNPGANHSQDFPRCEYCNENSPDLLFRCIEENCGRWFCNHGIIKESKVTHICHHLTYSNHKSIELHENNSTIPWDLRCIKCENTHIFSLGFVEVMGEVFCRVPCLIELEIDDQLWMPFYTNKSLRFTTVLEEFKYKKHILRSQANEIEDRELGIEPEYDEEISEKLRIRSVYPNLETYISTYIGLLKHNQNAEDKMSAVYSLKNIVFNFQFNNPREGFIYGDEYGCRFTKNDLITFKDPETKFSTVGRLVNIEDGKFFFELNDRPPNSTKKFDMSADQKNSSISRVIKQLQNLTSEKFDEDILDVLLGKRTEAFLKYFHNLEDYTVPGSRRLNSSQIAAIRNALRYKLSTIQGPPGTGKTETIVAIVYAILTLRGRSYQEMLELKGMSKASIEEIEEARRIGMIAHEQNYCVGLKGKEAADSAEVIRNSVYKEFKLNLNREIKALEEDMARLIIENRKLSNSLLFISSSLVEPVLDGNRIAKHEIIIKNFKKVSELNQKILQLKSIFNECSAVKPSINSLLLRASYESYKPKQELKPADDVSSLYENSNAKLSLLNYSYRPGSKILLCASSNSAVQHLASKIQKIYKNVIHIYARSREQDFKEDKRSLHYKIREMKEQNKHYQRYKNILDIIQQKEPRAKAKNLPKIKRNFPAPLEKDSDSFNSDEEVNKDNVDDIIREDSRLKILDFISIELLDQKGKKELIQSILRNMREISEREEKLMIENSEIICCTCATSNLKLLEKFSFQHVIIDEATQTLEPETIQTFLKGADHIVLVGDTQQLGAVVKCRKAGDLGLDIPLIQRLIDIKVPTKMLNVQYRMHPDIALFSNKTFYDGRIQNGVSFNDRVYKNFRFPDPIGSNPSFFYNIESQEDIGGGGSSYVNRFEATAIKKLLIYMSEQGVPGKHIAVITFYEGQRGFLEFFLKGRTKSNQEFFKEVEVMSVDSSQGREKEFIILSCVRSGGTGGVGFLNEYTRLNVAITRAMYGLIVCGNFMRLFADPLWRNLLDYYNNKELILEGDFENLTPMNFETEAIEYNVNKKNKYKTDEQIHNEMIEELLQKDYEIDSDDSMDVYDDD